MSRSAQAKDVLMRDEYVRAERWMRGAMPRKQGRRVPPASAGPTTQILGVSAKCKSIISKSCLILAKHMSEDDVMTVVRAHRPLLLSLLILISVVMEKRRAMRQLVSQCAVESPLFRRRSTYYCFTL